MLEETSTWADIGWNGALLHIEQKREQELLIKQAHLQAKTALTLVFTWRSCLGDFEN